jgi:uncharacterized protein YhaN
MRIDRLHLLRYGHFTDSTIDLPSRHIDLHILVGPNEAGKSTTLSAIESLLFGIPHSSTYGFLHDYNAMRIGAVLRNGDETLEVWRRKGTKNTLLGANELPLASGEAALGPFLREVDRNFFSRMFCLNHERLRQGGKEILDSQDDVGQVLLAASVGFSGLREKLEALQREADSLWAPRKAGHRKYYQALDRLQGVDKAIREGRVTASQWAAQKKAYDEVQREHDDLVKEQQSCRLQQRKLSRIRRVHRHIRQLAAIEEQLLSLGEATCLAPDAFSQLDQAERELRDAATGIETLQERLKVAEQERSEIQCDEALLLREDEVQQLHQRRIEVNKAKTDLSHRRTDLENAQASLRRLAEELGWDSIDIEALITRIPSRLTLQQAREALRIRGEKLSSVESARAASAEANDRMEELRDEISRIPVVDVSPLTAVIQSARNSGDLTTRMQLAETELAEAQRVIQSNLKTLHPAVTAVEELLSTAFPSVETVRHYRDTFRDETNRLEECRRQLFDADNEAKQLQQAIDNLTSTGDVVSSEQVTEARSIRDEKWAKIRHHFIEKTGPELSDSESVAVPDLPSAFEDAVRRADHLADQRLRNAEAVAQLEVQLRKLTEIQSRIESFRAREAMLEASLQARQQEWRQLWKATSVEPLNPELMLQWLATREVVLQAIERRARTESQLTSLREEEQRWISLILGELAAQGKPAGEWASRPLRVVIEGAAVRQSELEQTFAHRRRLEEELRNAVQDVERKRRLLCEAEQARESWQGGWAEIVRSLGLPADIGGEAAARYVEVLDQMREVVVQIHQLRHERIEKIERDITAFYNDVRAFLLSLGTDTPQMDPLDAILEIERRLEEAKRAKEQQNAKDQQIAALRADIEKRNDAKRGAQSTIQHLQELAGVHDIETLRAAVQRSDQFRELNTNRSQVNKSLMEDGDGLSLEELTRECESVDLDHVAEQELALEQKLRELESQRIAVVERKEAVRRDLESIGSGSHIAQLAAEREAVVTDMGQTVGQYLRVRTAVLLLQWAMDRYRSEKQAPLLTRAGQLFATLTERSFESLRVEFDDNDHPQLAGVRPSGSLVRVGGLSDGTADQLYLALRIAAVEDYLSTGNALPFVVDDLFINFDDRRAAAGLRALSELATRTQVLFFTHHRHLAEMARDLFGDRVSILDLQSSAALLRRTAAT